MAATTPRKPRYMEELDRLDTSPQPLRQGAWLMATMVIVVLFLAAKGTPAGTTPVLDPDTGGLAQDAPAPWPAAPLSLPSTGRVDGQAVTTADAELADRADEALALVAYPWERLLPEWRIEFLHQRDGLYGLTLVPEKRIEIYVRPDQGAVFLAHVIAHELGHAVDVELNSKAERAEWARVRDIEDEPWWPGSGATDFSTGAGDFAESFAAWQVGDGAFRSAIGDPPVAHELELLAELSAG